jgi:hypothetical protein
MPSRFAIMVQHLLVFSQIIRIRSPIFVPLRGTTVSFQILTTHAATFPSRRYAHSRPRLLHLFDVAFASRTECNRPTVFAERPLLTDGTSRYYDEVCGRVSGFHLAATASTQHPVHLHTSIRFRCLIPVHYSCRPCSPVGSEARIAVPNSPIRRFNSIDLRPKVSSG